MNVKISRHSSPIKSFCFENVNSFFIKLSKPCSHSIKTDMMSEEYPVNINVNKLKNRTIAYTSNLSGVKVVQAEIREDSVRVTFVSNTPYVIKAKTMKQS